MRRLPRARGGSLFALALTCAWLASACSDAPAPEPQSAVKADAGGAAADSPSEPARENTASSPSEAERAGAPKASLPNIVLVSIDTLRSDRTSAYGYGKETTPTLEALAAQGARVEQAYSHTATTAPSHATLFTSLYPIAHGVPKNGIPLAEEHPRLTEVVKKSGYDTAAFVSSYVLNGRFGLSEGFTEYDDEFVPTEGAATKCAKSKLERCANQTIDLALEWLDERRGDGPFFLFVHLFDPHAGYNPPPELLARFKDPAPKPEAGDKVVAAAAANDDGAKGKKTGRLLRFVKAMQVQSARYDGEIAFADQELARLLDALDRKGLASDTLVVVTADHGEALGQHGAITHGVTLYDDVLRIPMVFRWPGKIPAGTTVAGPVGLIDVMPTILDLTGIPRDSLGLQGESVAPALMGKDEIDAGRPIYLQRRSFESDEVGGIKVKGDAFGIRVGGWKYIESDARGSELYDLAADPKEAKNLVHDQPERAKALADQLQAWKIASRKGTGGKGAKVSDEDRDRLRALGYVD